MSREVSADPGSPMPIAGVRVGTACAGIKQRERPDITLFELAPGSRCAAVFTRNAFCAAPVTVARRHLAAASPRYWVINSGNANAGTGDAGLRDVLAVCEAVAAFDTDVGAQGVLPFSTGVIGEPLPVPRVVAALPGARAALSAVGWADAALAIMTTDTVPKAVSRKVVLEHGEATITGIAKGAGMIRPDMATMLAFIATDAALGQTDLQTALSHAVDRSFNRITVDGDTSTNDACILAATGAGPHCSGEDLNRFQAALDDLCAVLARAIVRDGEGATKLITIDVEGGATPRECLDVAYTIAHSPLVKTAFFASDPNWGRILACVGRAGIGDLDLTGVSIYLGGVCIVREGGRDPEYREEAGARAMAGSEVAVRVMLGRGACREKIWTCDLSYDYVRINAEYRT